MTVKQFKFCIVIVVILITLSISFSKLNASVLVEDSCRIFALGARDRYKVCSEQIKNIKKEDKSFNHSHLQWFNESKVQLKFLKQIASGQSEYVSVAFEMLPLLDGEWAEVILTSLGESIKVAPGIFLTNLRDYIQEINKLKAFPSLVTPTGSKYIDNTKARIIEIKKRIAAIKRINDPLLQEVKEMVLNELNRELEGYLHLN